MPNNKKGGMTKAQAEEVLRLSKTARVKELELKNKAAKAKMTPLKVEQKVMKAVDKMKKDETATSRVNSFKKGGPAIVSVRRGVAPMLDGMRGDEMEIEDIFPWWLVFVNNVSTDAPLNMRNKLCFFNPTLTGTARYATVLTPNMATFGQKLKLEMSIYQKFVVASQSFMHEYGQGANTSGTQGNFAFAKFNDPGYPAAVGNYKTWTNAAASYAGFTVQELVGVEDVWFGSFYQPKKSAQQHLKTPNKVPMYTYQSNASQGTINTTAADFTGGGTSVVTNDVIQALRQSATCALAVAQQGMSAVDTSTVTSAGDLFCGMLKCRTKVWCYDQSMVNTVSVIGAYQQAIKDAQAAQLYNDSLNKAMVQAKAVGSVSISNVQGTSTAQVVNGVLQTSFTGTPTAIIGKVSLVTPDGKDATVQSVAGTQMYQFGPAALNGDGQSINSVYIDSTGQNAAVNNIPKAVNSGGSLVLPPSVQMKGFPSGTVGVYPVVLTSGIARTGSGVNDPTVQIDKFGQCNSTGNDADAASVRVGIAVSGGASNADVPRNDTGSTVSTGAAAMDASGQTLVVSTLKAGDGKEVFAKQVNQESDGKLKSSVYGSNGANSLAVDSKGNGGISLQDAAAGFSLATDLKSSFYSSSGPLPVSIYTPSGAHPMNITNGCVEVGIRGSNDGTSLTGTFAKVETSGDVDTKVNTVSGMNVTPKIGNDHPFLSKFKGMTPEEVCFRLNLTDACNSYFFDSMTKEEYRFFIDYQNGVKLPDGGWELLKAKAAAALAHVKLPETLAKAKTGWFS